MLKAKKNSAQGSQHFLEALYQNKRVIIITIIIPLSLSETDQAFKHYFLKMDS